MVPEFLLWTRRSRNRLLTSSFTLSGAGIWSWQEGGAATSADADSDSDVRRKLHSDLLGPNLKETPTLPLSFSSRTSLVLRQHLDSSCCTSFIMT